MHYASMFAWNFIPAIETSSLQGNGREPIFYYGRSAIRSTPCAFKLPLHRPWIHEINVYLSRALDMGIVEKLHRDRNVPQATKAKDELAPISMDNLASALILLVAGLVLSFAAFLTELI